MNPAIAALFALLGLLQIADPTPTPAPTPAGPPRLVVALETEQGKEFERTALFSDGTLIHVIRYAGRSTSNRKTVTTDEIAVYRRISTEAMGALDMDKRSESFLADISRKRLRLDIGSENGSTRSFEFDDLTRLPLGVARIRGAVEELKGRFLEPPKTEDAWDPTDLHVGDLMKRRSDGKAYRVARSEKGDPNLELEEDGEGHTRLFVPRGEVPRIFDKPERPAPAP